MSAILPTQGHEFPEDVKSDVKKAKKLEWLTLAYLCTVVVLMYLVMGSSQAMKTAWVEDLLSMVPPIAFLVTLKIRGKKPNTNYPFGFDRATEIGYLVSSLALLIVGGYVLFDGVMKLIETHHPTVGLKSYFGVDIWLGWWMIAVLIWGTIPPVLLGRAKQKVARKMFNKILYTDSQMNKADWMTAVAAIAGVLGIGMGWWWADAVAAILISVDIVKDGFKQTRDSVTGLMDRAPKDLKGDYLDLPDKVVSKLEQHEVITTAKVRMREEGHLLHAEGFYQTDKDQPLSNEALRGIVSDIRGMDWRLRDFTLTVMEKSDS